MPAQLPVRVNAQVRKVSYIVIVFLNMKTVVGVGNNKYS
jgi:hypothetical protein